jgi:PhoPQ-activated pathogenicity-related protein
MRGTDALENVQAYYEAFLNRFERPRISWKFRRDGSILVKASGTPTAVKLWQASNPKTRDFRVDTIGRSWKDSAVAKSGDGDWVAKIDKPELGWTAYFVELTYPGPGKLPMKFTTDVRVTPDTLPFPPFHPNKP